MRRISVRRGVGTALTAMVVLVACGGDNTSTTPTTPLPTVPPDAGDISETTTTTIPSVYIVKAGQSLTAIAKMFGITVKDLVAFNGLADPNHIEEGQRLKIPPPTTTTTTIEP